MPISIYWPTGVISVPKTYLTLISGTLYELDTDQFRLDLKALEDNEQGITYLKTHNHFTEYTVAGVTYARAIIILAPYSVEFEDGQYSVRLVGSNNNIFDVENGILAQNQVQVIPGNSAGLIVKSIGSGLSSEQDTKLTSINTRTEFQDKVLKNRRRLVKDGDVWYLEVYDDNNSTLIMKKALKDLNVADIADVSEGDLCMEMPSSV